MISPKASVGQPMGDFKTFLQYGARSIAIAEREVLAFYSKVEDILIMVVILLPRRRLIPSTIFPEKAS